MPTDFTAPRVYRMPSADRVDSGAGRLEAAPRLLDRLAARRVVIATSRSLVANTPHVARLEALLADREVVVFPRCRTHSPDSDIDDLGAVLAAHRADAVVSIGGSSIFDTVKIATGRAAPAGGPAPIPQIAIPTTLSAGEFTSGAGYTEEVTRTKKLVLDDRVAPRYVILDPVVTVETPQELWLSSGVKALDHALEAVWSMRPHPFADALALEAIRLLFAHLPASRDPSALNHRAACQQAAWMSIAAAGGAGMRLSHFLGHQIGARMHISHGVTSCIILPPVMRHLAGKTLEAQGRIAAAMGLDTEGLTPEAAAAAAADRLEAFIADLGLPNSIRGAGGDDADIEAITIASYEAAQQLGLAGDLPHGAESIRAILLQA